MKKPKNSSSNLIWSPTAEFKENSNMQDYLYWLENNYSYNFENYGELWDWSTSAPDEFWESMLEYYRVLYNGKYKQVRNGTNMWQTKWFEGLELSYSEHIFRKYSDNQPAVYYRNESGQSVELSWQDLVQKVASMRQFLLDNNVVKGDRVAAFLNNSPEALISFLAANSIGAIWSSASCDFGASSVIERFSQIEPKVLIAAQQYSYNGKIFDKTDVVQNICNGIKSIERVVIVGHTQAQSDYIAWDQIMEIEAEELRFERVEFSHPIWILYSSGTTGAPKAITHSTGGILLEHFKILGLHNNVKPGDRFFWFTTTGWMMWNYQVSALLHGASIVLYEGSPSFPQGDSLWALAEEFDIQHFGLGASFVVSCMKNGYRPAEKFDLSGLLSIGSTGSPLPPEGFDWLENNVKSDLWISSISGGTDVCSAFVAGNPLKNLYSGEIQCIALGCDLAVYDSDGVEVIDQIGEMVIKKPMPSMPVYFWGDQNFAKYKESYFEYFPGVWRHGDWAKITPDESVIIYGRSDATLNRGGVRIGTSEIYRAIDLISYIEDSLLISKQDDQSDLIIVFLKLNNNLTLNEDHIAELKRVIKIECSPRHIPDLYFQVKDIPYTISGKKMEAPIKKIFQGKDANDVLKVGSMKNPESLEDFVNIAKAIGDF